MAYYPLSVLMLSGIRDILVISTPLDLPMFRRLLGDGSQLGCRFSYAEQPSPDGLAQAFLIGAEWLAGEACALVLGDNMIFGDHLSVMLQANARRAEGATVFAYQVRDPERYGVVSFDADGPGDRHRGEADHAAVQLGGDRAVFLRPPGERVRPPGEARPPRGELEITDLNRLYLEIGAVERGAAGPRAAPGWTPARRTACCRRPPSCRPSSPARGCWSAARRRWRSAWASSTPRPCGSGRWRCARPSSGGCCWKSRDGVHA